MKFSELDRDMIAVLRIQAALEPAYPEIAASLGNRRPSVILAGWKAWKLKASRNPSEGSVNG